MVRSSSTSFAASSAIIEGVLEIGFEIKGIDCFSSTEGNTSEMGGVLNGSAFFSYQPK